MSGIGRTLALVWIISGLALLPALDSPQVSRTALMLLPWLIWAGWPAGGGPPDASRPERWIPRVLPALGLAAPLLALGVELDLASGRAVPGTLLTVLVGLLLLAVGAAARTEFARAGGRAATGYGGFWLIAVLLLPIFVSVVEFGTPDAARWGRAARMASPIGWCIDRVTLAPVVPTVQGAYPSLALVLLTWGAATLLGRRSGR